MLEPRGVLAVIGAEHLCVAMRGVRDPGSTTVTSAVRGLFRDSQATRAGCSATARPPAGHEPRAGDVVPNTPREG